MRVSAFSWIRLCKVSIESCQKFILTMTNGDILSRSSPYTYHLNVIPVKFVPLIRNDRFNGRKEFSEIMWFRRIEAYRHKYRLFNTYIIIVCRYNKHIDTCYRLNIIRNSNRPKTNVDRSIKRKFYGIDASNLAPSRRVYDFDFESR